MAALTGSTRTLPNWRKFKISCIINTYRRINLEADIIRNDVWKMDADVEKRLKEKAFKHKKHPGIYHQHENKIPDSLQSTISSIYIKTNQKKIVKFHSSQLFRQLWNRQQPTEEAEIQAKAQEIHLKLVAEVREKLDEEELQQWEQRNKKKMQKKLRDSIYNWKPVDYNRLTGLAYLVGRMGLDYSVLCRIFSEISVRAPNFQPTTLFDFGSGVGTTIWAANHVWENSFKEHFCVDTSEDMNTIARLVLQDGDPDKEMCFPGVFFRQVLPASYQLQYDLVVSAFSLLDLCSKQDRLNTLLNLWRKTKEFLVIVELGTVVGYKTVLEARDYLLQVGKEEGVSSHIFAPCPHDGACPHFLRQDRLPCHFQVNYHPVSTDKKNVVPSRSTFSFVVLRKGDRPQKEIPWPRIVGGVTNASRCTHVQMCTAAGRLSNTRFSRKTYDKDMLWIARYSKWGDRLPVIQKFPEEEMSQTVNEEDSCKSISKDDRVMLETYCENDPVSKPE